jgi:hypothetical protein
VTLESCANAFPARKNTPVSHILEMKFRIRITLWMSESVVGNDPTTHSGLEETRGIVDKSGQTLIISEEEIPYGWLPRRMGGFLQWRSPISGTALDRPRIDVPEAASA